MSLTKLHSAAFLGLEALPIDVEIDVTHSDSPNTVIVGLPDVAVKESKERVRSALKNMGVKLSCMQCTINLAPGGLKKVGSFYDLPIALGLITALNKQKCPSQSDYLTAGELGLDGSLRPMRGALLLALLAKKLKKKGVILPKANAKEAAVVTDIDVIGVNNLQEAAAFLRNHASITPEPPLPFSSFRQQRSNYTDFAKIRGQTHLKRAAEIAAAGNHNMLIFGPPGAGKTLLAHAFPGILPDLSLDEALETTAIYSAANLLPKNTPLISERPFRSPHHTISYAGLVGGGTYPRPGEISLAHNGVLFLDELPEFSRTTLEVLRQPLEEGKITVSRAASRAVFPSKCLFIGAMNPCPCGYLTHPSKPCTCSELQISRYRQKISGPLLDRIDMHLAVSPVKYEELADTSEEESSAAIRERVIAAQERTQASDALCSTCHTLLKEATETLNLSARSIKRIISVAATIATLEDSAHILEDHLLEALSFRSSL